MAASLVLAGNSLLAHPVLWLIFAVVIVQASLDSLQRPSLDALLPMQRACIASVQGQYGEALGLYERHLADAQRQGLVRLTGNYLADMAWCRWHLGDRAGAERDAEAAAAAIDTSMHMDDQATAHGRLGMMFKLLDDEPSAARHAARGRECWAEHRKYQAIVVKAVDAAALTL